VTFFCNLLNVFSFVVSADSCVCVCVRVCVCVCVSTPAWLNNPDISFFPIPAHSILTHLHSLQHTLMPLLPLSIFVTCHPKKGYQLASETLQESEARLVYLRNRAAASRASETPHETNARLAYQRNTAAAFRASESQHDTETRLAYQRNLAAASRASETPLETEARPAYQRNRVAASRASVTLADLRLIAFAYNPNVNYHEHPNVIIGNMDAVCSYCAATKWKDEPPGLCCRNGKVQLPPLLPPCELLKSLMSGYTSDSKHFLQHIRQYNSCFQMTSFGATKEIRGEGGVHANIQSSRTDLSQSRFAAPYVRCRPTILTNLLHGRCSSRSKEQVLQSARHKT